MNFDVNMLLNVPEFSYGYDNKPIMAEWQKILGKPTPRKRKKVNSDISKVIVLNQYFDLELNRMLEAGTIVEMTNQRISTIMATNKSLIKVLEG